MNECESMMIVKDVERNETCFFCIYVCVLGENFLHSLLAFLSPSLPLYISILHTQILEDFFVMMIITSFGCLITKNFLFLSIMDLRWRKNEMKFFLFLLSFSGKY